jgi:SAM-dependent methyltransferase
MKLPRDYEKGEKKVKKRKPVCPFILYCLFIWPIAIFGQCPTVFSQVNPVDPKDIKLDVPYEPSSEDVVSAMLEIAKVTKDDFVYDLGCGDGRIVIAAAQKTGARGVGVDLDPERIKESRENARKAGVTDHITFYQQDLFQTEIGEATVVMLYLFPEINLKLRPRLFRELKPGTRVVSHSHDMGAWEPDETRTVPTGHRVHFWTMPANMTGIWNWVMAGEKEPLALTLNQEFQKISGTLRRGAEIIPIKDPQLSGDRLKFAAELLWKGKLRTLRFTARVRGHLLEGTVQGMNEDPEGKQPWNAMRNPSSMKSLDF